MLAGLLSSETSLPGSQRAVLLLCPHMAFPLCVCALNVCVQISSSDKNLRQMGLVPTLSAALDPVPK